MATFTVHDIAENLAFQVGGSGGSAAYAVPSSIPIEVVAPVQADSAAWEYHDAKLLVLQEFSAAEELRLTSGFDFFERMHVVPRSFSFGNVLSDIVDNFEVFSGYRHTFTTWTAFTPVDDPGTTVPDFPGVPSLVPPLGGFYLEIDVSTDGNPVVDDAMIFVFDDGGVIEVPVEIRRIVLFFPRPELPFAEILEFLTDVQEARDGSEVRPSLRKNPRQAFEYDYKLDEDDDRMALEASVFDWQAQAFGVPVWMDETELAVAVSAGASVIDVVSTDYADFRIGGLVVVLTDRRTFDVQTIIAITSTTITLENVLLNSYPAGTSVLPVVTASVGDSLDGSRYPVGLALLSARFDVDDNDIDIASTAAFSTFNGKVLLDDPNAVRGRTSGESYRTKLYVTDGETGLVDRVSLQDRSKRVSMKTFVARGRQARWELRQLLHALRGRQVSFYLQRFRQDLTATQSLVSGTSSLTINNVGYTQYVRNRKPLNVIRITFTNGDPDLMRTVTGSVVVDDEEETLTLDATWPNTYAPSDVDRIQFVEHVRLDSDEVRIEYELGGYVARATVPVKAVFA